MVLRFLRVNDKFVGGVLSVVKMRSMLFQLHW